MEFVYFAVVAVVIYFVSDRFLRGLEARRESLAADRSFLHCAVGDRIAWADQRIHALDDLIHDRFHTRVVH